MASSKRSYLPRSTMSYAAIRTVYEYAEEQKIPFGKALEKLLLESMGFKSSLDKLADGSEWFKQDVDDLKKANN